MNRADCGKLNIDFVFKGFVCSIQERGTSPLASDESAYFCGYIEIPYLSYEKIFKNPKIKEAFRRDFVDEITYKERESLIDDDDDDSRFVLGFDMGHLRNFEFGDNVSVFEFTTILSSLVNCVIKYGECDFIKDEKRTNFPSFTDERQLSFFLRESYIALKGKD